jgi:formate dehydrogenase iron-sulfur subunit
MRDRYPNAQVYGETQAGGLGLLVVMPDDPELLDIPIDPKTPFMADAWQKIVQPASVGITIGAAVVAGAAAVIARRRHEEELNILEEQGVISGHGDDGDEEEVE